MNFWIEITPIDSKAGSGKTVLHLDEKRATYFMADVLHLSAKQIKRLIENAAETNSKSGFCQVPYLRIEIYADKD